MFQYDPKIEFKTENEFIWTFIIRFLKIRYWIGLILFLYLFPVIAYFFDYERFVKVRGIIILISVIVFAMFIFSSLYFAYEAYKGWRKKIIFEDSSILISDLDKTPTKLNKSQIVSWSRVQGSLSLMVLVDNRRILFYMIFQNDVPKELLALIEKYYSVHQYKNRGF